MSLNEDKAKDLERMRNALWHDNGYSPPSNTTPATDNERLNQMLRDHGYGQGSIDTYVAQCAELEALQKFKAYVHQRLDEAGVPTHPNGKHSAHGCRVGDRLDLLIGERDWQRENLHWYAEESRAIAKNLRSRDMEAVMASLHVLALDNGRRASAGQVAL